MLILWAFLGFWLLMHIIDTTWRKAEDLTARKFRHRLEALEDRIKALESRR